MTKEPVYNPLSKDFSVTYDVSGEGKPELFTIHAGEIEYFDPIIARHIKKHLAQDIVWSNRNMSLPYDTQFAQSLQLVEVSLQE